MKFSSSAVLAILSAIATVQAGSTKKVSYQGVGYSGSYKDVTAMDEDSGSCSQETKTFSGKLAPLDEELSAHFRGPLKLLQFGVYYPSSGSNNKKREDEEECTTKHVHHKHKRATEVVEVTQTVIVDGNGNTQTSLATTTATAGSGDNDEQDTTQTSTASAAATGGSGSGSGSSSASSSSSASESSSESSSDSSVAAGDWERVAYYTPGSTDNVTFLNYYGGSGSGVWSSSFGNSLSYANKDASGGSSSAVALEETTIDSNVEYVIMSGSKCDGDDCDLYREGIPAYHGFGGNTKIMVFEFEMPSATDSASFNYDMPAIWLLNAKIPRTLQYGDEECSCWKTGCGELDLFEVITSGSDELICHLHSGQGDNGSAQGGGGSSDYFERPTSGSMKAAVIFSDGEVNVVEVDDDFGSSLDSSTVKSWVSESGSKAVLQG
jgi:hypothetical protein